MPSDLPSPTDLELLRLHVEAVWDLHLLPSLAPGDLHLLVESAPAEWSAYLAEVGGEEVRLWHPAVPATEYEALATRMRAALAASTEVVLPGVGREVALARREPARPVPEGTQRLIRALSPADAPLLEAFEPGSTTYYTDPRRAPVIGIERDGQLFTIAHSSRRTREVCELGIETLPEARRHDYALAATVRWAELVAVERLVPLYSAHASNAASLALAHAAGFRPFAHAAYLVRAAS
jgi:hypothetical protein